jgi:hypothetical protein
MRQPGSTQVNAHFTPDEIGQIDTIRGLVGLSRGAFVRLCVQSMLNNKKTAKSRLQAKADEGKTED